MIHIQTSFLPSSIQLTNPKQLSTPLLTPEQMKAFILQTLQPLGDQDPLAIVHLNVNAQSQRSAFKEELLTYLQSVALHYQDIRVRGSRPKPF